MKRQARLALFLQREQMLLNRLLHDISGYAGLYFGARHLDLNVPSQHFFYSGSQNFAGIDAVFNDHEWPIPQDYFDLVVLDHPIDLACAMEDTLAEAMRVLRRDGVLVISGFNKTRLCSWPIQNNFAKTANCPIKRYSALTLMSQLDEKGFSTDIHYFDFCRFKVWNKILAKIIPFLGIGFIMIAKRKTIDLKPLEEFDWNFNPKKILAGALQPEPECCGEKRHVCD